MAKVLVVDEDEVLRDFLQESLRVAGYDVDVAPSPDVNTADYDAVLSDIEKPFSLEKLQRRLRLMGLTHAA